VNINSGARVSARRGPFLPILDGQRRSQRARKYGTVTTAVGQREWSVMWDDGAVTVEKSTQLRKESVASGHEITPPGTVRVPQRATLPHSGPTEGTEQPATVGGGPDRALATDPAPMHMQPPNPPSNPNESLQTLQTLQTTQCSEGCPVAPACVHACVCVCVCACCCCARGKKDAPYDCWNSALSVPVVSMRMRACVCVRGWVCACVCHVIIWQCLCGRFSQISKDRCAYTPFRYSKQCECENARLQPT
jgi:hypothetical protein